MSVRAVLVKVHLWLGLAAAPVLLVVGLTGALLVVESPLTDRLDAATALVEPRGAPRRIAERASRRNILAPICSPCSYHETVGTPPRSS